MNELVHPDKTIGKPASFKLAPFLQAAEILVECDEVERALLLLDNLPGYYRDYEPIEVNRLKLQIQNAMVTPHGYQSDTRDSQIDRQRAVEVCQSHPRGVLLKAEIDRLNDQGIKPHLVDFGPGEFWALLGLDALHCRFTYEPICLNENNLRLAWESVGEGHSCKPRAEAPTIFVALEIIEHLSDPKEIAIEAIRHGRGKMPHYIHLSTPLYTYDCNFNWRKPNGLPHLRTYTPEEFLAQAKELFDNQYHWNLYLSNVMSLRGVRKDLPFTQLEISWDAKAISQP